MPPLISTDRTREDPADGGQPVVPLASAAGGKAHDEPLRAGDEFPPDAHRWLPEISRRTFLELMGASLALAGLDGCNRPPAKLIVPYVTPPDRSIAEETLFYATAVDSEGYGRGILVEAHAGRPTKIEGNPQHPESLGATDAMAQASVLSLYDPDRSRAPMRGDTIVAWEDFESEWLARHASLAATHGRGLALLTEPTTSPTLLRQIHALLEAFPEARWFQHTALPRYDESNGQDDYDFAEADVVLAIDSDFLTQHPASIRFSRAFATRRRVVDGKINANRLFAIEPTPTLTGAMADQRIAASPARIRVLLNGIARELGVGVSAEGNLTTAEQDFVGWVAGDLKRHAPRIACVAGAQCDPEVRAWAASVNAQLGADRAVVRRLPAVRSDSDSRCAGDLAALTKALRAGEVNELVIVGGNPVYTAPTDLDFAPAMLKAKWRLHVGLHRDETAARCDWHLPQSHSLEAWGDLVAYEGTATLQQPLIVPLYGTRSALEIVHFLAHPPGAEGYDLVRETWQQNTRTSGDSFDARWAGWLNAGVVPKSEWKPSGVPGRNRRGIRALPVLKEQVVVLLRPDPTVADGRWANNAWLQELPKPITSLVWDNAAFVSAGFAQKRGFRDEDEVRIRTAHGEVAAPVWIVPGQADDCITLHLGYGRTNAGSVGNHHGTDAYRIRSSTSPWTAEVIALENVGRSELVTTQHHFRMEGRDLVHVERAAEIAKLEPPRSGLPVRDDYAGQPSLFPEWPYPSYRWAMAIDLATCTGCSACVVACQAENNIPVVGKDQVSRGREMHWIRVDKYFVGEISSPRILHQPVPCMQCEHAPCELVCPVGATVHSNEGLNDMVYNRCVGTRYCSNNCPYKVRRFNFLNFQAPAGSPVYLQKNPNVSVRDRGVMEKCTYCVQRIDAGRIRAEKENRRVRDGEIRTACQQACPVEAIVFGDLSDPASRVVARKREANSYALLEELNTRPRTTYLAKVINPVADEGREPA